MESDLPNFSLNLDFRNFENETPNKRVKKMSEEELDTSVEDQKRPAFVDSYYSPDNADFITVTLNFVAENLGTVNT